MGWDPSEIVKIPAARVKCIIREHLPYGPLVGNFKVEPFVTKGRQSSKKLLALLSLWCSRHVTQDPQRTKHASSTVSVILCPDNLVPRLARSLIRSYWSIPAVCTISVAISCFCDTCCPRCQAVSTQFSGRRTSKANNGTRHRRRMVAGRSLVRVRERALGKSLVRVTSSAREVVPEARIHQDLWRPLSLSGLVTEEQHGAEVEPSDQTDRHASNPNRRRTNASHIYRCDEAGGGDMEAAHRRPLAHFRRPKAESPPQTSAFIQKR